MSEYRIKKGDREFTATRLTTLQELMARGLLRGQDPVAVDDGPFRPAREYPELASFLPDSSKDSSEGGSKPIEAAESSDPFRHFSGLTIDEPGTDDGSDLLASFMGQLGNLEVEEGTEPSKTSDLPPPPPAPRPDPRRVVRPEPDPAPVPELALEPRPSPPSVTRVESAPPPPAPPRPGGSFGGGLGGGVETTPGQAFDEADLPVSFRQWLEQKGDEESPLSRFGRYDEAMLAAERQQSSGFNLFRVLLVLVVGLTTIAIGYAYVHTGATREYPLESTLAERIPGATRLHVPDSSEKTSAASPEAAAPPAEPVVTSKEVLLKVVRSKLRGGVEDFATAEDLEDALFRELTNFGAMPIGVTVAPLKKRGSADRYTGRPTQAHLEISLGAIVVEGEAGYELLEERLILSWLLVGKYQTLGKVRFEDVRVRVRPPLGWDKLYQGRRLAAFWDGQVDVEQLFIPKN